MGVMFMEKYSIDKYIDKNKIDNAFSTKYEHVDLKSNDVTADLFESKIDFFAPLKTKRKVTLC